MPKSGTNISGQSGAKMLLWAWGLLAGGVYAVALMLKDRFIGPQVAVCRVGKL